MTRVTPRARWALAAAAVAVAAVLPAAAPAGAAPSPATGNDVSYPQCQSHFPTGAAFGVVGVDDGIANVVNPCLTAEIAWAGGTSGTAASSYATTPQPRAQLYVNTADPGDVYNGQPIADWPSNNVGGGTDPYGACTTTVVKIGHHKTTTVGQNSPACAWQYGWNAATKDAQTFFGNAVSGQGALDQNAGDYPWWLDVETGNTWQSSSGGLAMNDAVLEGMVTSFSTLRTTGGAAAAVGIYSTGYQWNQIAGGETTVDGNWSTLAHATGPAPLDGQPDWVPGAISTAGADSTCTANAAFTRTSAVNANVTLAQWVSGGVDGDVSC
jgi:hypothetical protein